MDYEKFCEFSVCLFDEVEENIEIDFLVGITKKQNSYRSKL